MYFIFDVTARDLSNMGDVARKTYEICAYNLSNDGKFSYLCWNNSFSSIHMCGVIKKSQYKQAKKL